MVRGTCGKVQPPIDDIETYWTQAEKEQASAMLKYSFVGSPDTVRPVCSSSWKKRALMSKRRVSHL